MAQDQSNTNTDILFGRVDEFIEEHGCEIDEFFPLASQEPILGATCRMQSLHDSVLYIEKRRIK